MRLAPQPLHLGGGVAVDHGWALTKRTEEVARLGVELVDQAPDDLLEHAFG